MAQHHTLDQCGVARFWLWHTVHLVVAGDDACLAAHGVVSDIHHDHQGERVGVLLLGHLACLDLVRLEAGEREVEEPAVTLVNRVHLDLGEAFKDGGELTALEQGLGERRLLLCVAVHVEVESCGVGGQVRGASKLCNGVWVDGLPQHHVDGLLRQQRERERCGKVAHRRHTGAADAQVVQRALLGGLVVLVFEHEVFCRVKLEVWVERGLGFQLAAQRRDLKVDRLLGQVVVVVA
ncbi:hypothetical protein OGAPHI_003347 [Ogataea philodendri]|uniref:Uncharacterized protein n=1 Tax=Ogataea philodendri TaxID=1378263 RepID=A0A9P8P8R6_9ASCO|nr:uncharacterized protein OGAPHI_003347 [Ogataea philodendri]KAH3666897.1 hypothetical protein OGAPHI_003347 [Ogataea philodendri]